MLRGVEDRARSGPASTISPACITMHAVGDGAHDGEIVGDEEIAQAAARSERSASRSRICARTEHVERRDRLVEDDQRRAG